MWDRADEIYTKRYTRRKKHATNQNISKKILIEKFNMNCLKINLSLLFRLFICRGISSDKRKLLKRKIYKNEGIKRFPNIIFENIPGTKFSI